MKRYKSNIIYCNPQTLLRNHVIEQDDNYIITRIINLDFTNSELEQTLFLNGIISSEIISLKESVSVDELEKIKNMYQYLDLSTSVPTEIIMPTNRKLVLDFRNASEQTISSKLQFSAHVLYKFSIFDIISACTWLPSLLSNQNPKLEVNTHTRLLHWGNIDFSKRILTNSLTVRLLP